MFYFRRAIRGKQGGLYAFNIGQGFLAWVDMPMFAQIYSVQEIEKLKQIYKCKSYFAQKIG
jgi:hypothetical protein